MPKSTQQQDTMDQFLSHPQATVRDLPKHLRTFQTYIGARMYVVFGLGVLAALSESIGIVMLLPLLQTVDALQMEAASGIGRVIADALAWLGIADSVPLLLLVIGVFFMLKGLFLFLATGYKAYLSGQLTRELKGRLYDDYVRMRLEYYVARDTGHFLNVIGGQVDGFVRTFVSMLGFGLSAIKALVYVAIAIVIAWRFGLMTIVLGVLLLLAFRNLNNYVRRLSRKKSLEAGHLSKLMIQSLHAFKYLTATGQSSKVRKGVIRSVHLLAGYAIRTGLAKAFTASVREPITVMAILIIVIAQLVWLNQPLAPILISILLFKRGLDSMLGTLHGWQQAMSEVGSLEMVRDEFARQAKQRERDGAVEIGPLSRAIEFKDVHFAYNRQTSPVLKGVSLTIPAKTSVAIVGESGAGKSTLADMLTLVLRPTSGQILIDGVPSETIRLASWREQIGFVSQETVVFDDTIANNICLWGGDIDKDPHLFERVREAARLAYLDDTIEALPDGYHTFVGDRGVRLSGGQRQRLFIAREIFRNPKLLILDEATSALDSESELAIRNSIDALKGQITVVVIAHRLATIRNVDQVLVLEKGKVREAGSYADLRDDPSSRFARLVAAQKL